MDGETEISTFAQSRILMETFGSEESFNAMVSDETKALTTPEGIVKFLNGKALELGESAGGAALKWASAQLLNALGLGGGSSELQRIAAMLDTILQQQAVIMRQLTLLLEEVKFQHLVTRASPSVQRISNIHEQLKRLSILPNPSERKREAERLQSAILEAHNGTMANLKVVSDVLLGRDDPLAVSDPLIRLFSSRWQPLFLERQLRPDVPLSTYWRKLEEWLHATFIVQYQGLTQLANARIANGDFETLKQEITDTVSNMTAQRAMLNEAIPPWTRTLPASVTDGRSYIVRGPHMHAGRWDISHVLYGGTMLEFLDPEARKRLPRHTPNGEQWRFQKSNPNGGPSRPDAPNDCFFLRQGEQHKFVALDRGKVALRPYAALLRLVMAPTNGRQGWGPGPFVPALGLVGTSGPSYLFWRRDGARRAPVLAGGLNEAAILEIVPVGR